MKKTDLINITLLGLAKYEKNIEDKKPLYLKDVLILNAPYKN